MVDTIKEHHDEVLHVSFSHNGVLFATCSKDGYVKCWNTMEFPVDCVYQADMVQFLWKFPQFSAFNSSDTLLLVSGVHFGPLSSTGEIIIFGLDDKFTVQSRVRFSIFPWTVLRSFSHRHSTFGRFLRGVVASLISLVFGASSILCLVWRGV